jgi:glycosyltransferase involved in cell wall biosynthesis/2-polyprenyl-3-methyl-5-hydroxy-6-metoxy-1,4-benzoquinol methylase/predicted  nucleic acid-binding Zn-ribbon protein
VTGIGQDVSEVRADEEPLAATEDLHPSCPICGSRQTKFLCTVDNYHVWRCPASAVDFVHPVPTAETLNALYDRLEWFEGGERGGYASYDTQTDPSPSWLVELLDRLAAERPSPSILDIGCAYGTHLGLAKDKGWQPFGVEPSQHARAEARRRHPGLYVAKTIEEIPPHRFDLILILDVIEHLADPYPLFRELAAKDAIGPETIVVLTTPNARSRDALVDPAGWVYRHPPSHLTYYSASALDEMLRRLRFARVQVRGQHPLSGASAEPYADEASSGNQSLTAFAGLLCEATECDLAAFMQERYIPGTWSEIAAYEHVPRYAFAAALAVGARTLDFGCGSGYGADMLAQTASSVVGLDVSEEALSYARSDHRRDNLSFLHDLTLGASLPAGAFDVITCFEVIEHVDADTQPLLIASLRRLLAYGGKLLISTPNPEMTALYGANPYHLHEMTLGEFRALLAAEFRHVKFFNQSVHASVFLTPEQNTDFAEVKRGIPEFEGEDRPAAYIAICSESPLVTSNAMIFPDFGIDYIKQRVLAIERRNLQLIDRSRFVGLEASVAQIRALAEKTETQLLQAQAEVEGSEGLLNSHRLELAATQAELGAERERRAGAEVEVGAERERRVGTEAELGAERERRAGAEVELGADRERRASAEVELGAERERRAGTEAELGAERERRAGAEVELGAERERRAGTEAELGATQATLRTALSDLDQARTRLTQIEGQLSFRVVRACAFPFRTFGHGIRDVGRRIRGRDRRQHETGPSTPVNGERTSEPSFEPQALDVNLECILDPVWNPTQQKFELRIDTVLTARADPNPPPTMKPYTVRPNFSGADNRPKILHVIPNVYIGGSTRLVADLVERLSDRFEHEIVTSALCPYGEHQGMIVHHVSQPSVAAMAQLYGQFRPDIVHFHYWGLSDDPWYEAALAAMDGFHFAAMMNVNTPIKPMISPRFSHYVFVSDYVRTTFGGDVPDPSKTSVIHPGIDLSLFNGPYSDPDAENAVGMVYRLEEDKLRNDAIDLFIEIVRQRPRTKIYVIGGGTFLAPYLERTIAAGVRNNFRFTNYVPYEELPKWYDRFAIFVAPVWTESFGQVAPFAMRKGSAVAGYAVGALSEILGSSETLGADLQRAAEIVVALLNDPVRIRAIGRQNEDRAATLFDIKSTVSRYGEVYDQVLAEWFEDPGGLPKVLSHEPGSDLSTDLNNEQRARADDALLQLNGLRAQVDEYAALASQARGLVHQVTRSRSWRLTRPLRKSGVFGRREKRLLIEAPKRDPLEQIHFTALPLDGRPVVVIVSHEASRTGAPILGLNLAERFSATHRVVSLLWSGGELASHFEHNSAVLLGPLKNEDRNSINAKRLAEKIVHSYNPEYVIANSVETHLMVVSFAELGVSCIALIHEFASYTRPQSKFRDVCDHASALVFPGNEIAGSVFALIPQLSGDHRVYIRPQGRCILPRVPADHGPRASAIRPAASPHAFVVLGAGYVHMRKGVDLFIATAARVRRLLPSTSVRFVWIGDGYDPDADVAYSSYLAEQIRSSGLDGTLAMLPAYEDLASVYSEVDAFFMCSRLDPQPNVAIEAMARGIPVVCFERASGSAEIISSDTNTSRLVVPYLDVGEAAEVICSLVSDRALLRRTGDAVARLAKAAYDMDAYVEFLKNLGENASRETRRHSD